MKYISIDYGLKRTGIAVSDPEGKMAFPRKTVAMKDRNAFIEGLKVFIEKEKIEAIVLGLPLYSDGSDSETTRMIRNVASRLKHHTSLPVYFMEESLSSFEAEKLLRKRGKNPKEIKELVDQAAAVAILESFLTVENKKELLA